MTDDVTVSSSQGHLPRFDVASAEARAGPKMRPRAKARRRGDDGLADMIAKDIIPRLLVGLRTYPSEPSREVAGAMVTSADRSVFLEQSVAGSGAGMFKVVDDLLRRGVGPETILLDLMTPVARMLGVLWERDDITFVDVTVAVQNMQVILHDLCPPPAIGVPETAPSALLLPICGETHTFGIMIVSELLRRRGWNARTGRSETVESAVSSTGYTMIGFTVSCDAGLERLPAVIETVRRVSVNRGVVVVAGGRVFDTDAERSAREVGADAVFADAGETIAFADRLAAVHQTAYVNKSL
jgi:methanogenic corrinoid protein MtbC1